MKIYAIAEISTAKIENSATQITVLTSDKPIVTTPVDREENVYLSTFTNASLVNSQLTVPFDSTGNEVPDVSIFDDNNMKIYPYDVMIKSPSTVVIDLTGYTPIDGIWHIKVN